MMVFRAPARVLVWFDKKLPHGLTRVSPRRPALTTGHYALDLLKFLLFNLYPSQGL